jgi:homeobox-leucine zipper protein
MEEGAALSSSPNSAVSSFQMDFSARRGAAETTSGGASAGNGDPERKAADGSHSRASDEDETGSSRKKLRLSKEQSVFLEESFKEHNTLNPVRCLHLIMKVKYMKVKYILIWFCFLFV